ncbi:hypothetical protein BGX33_008897 [Mortierella sp. NVP41]|nr:hypothetical protein BGX33_008897 [Mortierella sp. NVP41]
MSKPVEQAKPTVLIVGAGLGGIMLGALLERCDIPYTIFERAATVKPLGAALAPIFEQIGVYDEFLSFGKALTVSTTIKDTMEAISSFDYTVTAELSGYSGNIIARPLLYGLLLKQIPTDKIHFGKRVLSISEEEEKVTVETADKCVYQGDILVGADGAYSAVRQRLYERLLKAGKLPKSDQEELPFSCTCLVGQTRPLDPEIFPHLKDGRTPFVTILGKDKPFTWVLFTTAQNTVCWVVLHHLDSITSKAAQEQRFRNSDNSEWGPYAAQSMCDETRDFPIPIGTGSMTLGDLYNCTPKELISKVMLEEKVFKTWYSGRTVLLGDACHKVHPAGGQGAVAAMHDAIALANLLYALPTNTTRDVEQIFADYQAERLPLVTEAYNSSRSLAKGLEKGLAGIIALFITRHIPPWLWKIFWARILKNRPIVGFLEPIANKGTVPPDETPSSRRARAVYERRKTTSAAAEAAVSI